jgi:DeoR/GlpR family transcriptional regulator of sugar metabolism
VRPSSLIVIDAGGREVRQMASVDEFAREQAILEALRATGHVSVNALAGDFGVSAVTVRKDLGALERRNLLRRVRGGAVGVDASDEGTFETRMRHSTRSKQAVARAAATLVDDGDVIAIDSSTTCFYLAQELLGRRNLVVITNGLHLAVLFMQLSSARVLVPGGVVRRSAGSLVGPIGDVLAGRGRIAKGFFGVVGLSTLHGLMDISVEEAQTKRFMADACERVYGLFDLSKVDGFGLHSFAAPDTITGLFTDDTVSGSFIDQWGALGVPVTVVPALQNPPAGTGRRRQFTGTSTAHRSRPVRRL